MILYLCLAPMRTNIIGYISAQIKQKILDTVQLECVATHDCRVKLWRTVIIVDFSNL
jgi:hypothetical protein